MKTIFTPLLGILTLLYMLRPSAVPRNYTQTVATGGPIEAAYLQMGEYEVERRKIPVLQSYEAYELFFPAAALTESRRWPVVVMCNGTGLPASKYRPIFEHLASWGFIVVGTEDTYSWNGFSAEMSLQYLLKMNDTEGSLLYQKVDTEHIGVAGHSQGGVGVVTTITHTEHKDLYKAAYLISPAFEDLSDLLEWEYDPSLIDIPVFLTAGTEVLDAGLISPLDGLLSIYHQAEAAPLRILARKTGYDHPSTLYETDGYMTAWFCWLLQDDEYAAGAFTGENPEVMTNPLYQDQILAAAVPAA